eukprot:5609015-Prymnesium_polylepis.1
MDVNVEAAGPAEAEAPATTDAEASTAAEAEAAELVEAPAAAASTDSYDHAAAMERAYQATMLLAAEEEEDPDVEWTASKVPTHIRVALCAELRRRGRADTSKEMLAFAHELIA